MYQPSSIEIPFKNLQVLNNNIHREIYIWYLTNNHNININNNNNNINNNNNHVETFIRSLMLSSSSSESSCLSSSAMIPSKRINGTLMERCIGSLGNILNISRYFKNNNNDSKIELMNMKSFLNDGQYNMDFKDSIAMSNHLNTIKILA